MVVRSSLLRIILKREITDHRFPCPINTDLSHPKWTDIERFDDGPEVGFEIEGVGRCHGCAEADPQTLRRMEKNGELEKPDPWGFMEVIEVAAGSSDTGEQMSNEAIALGITDTALADMREGNRNVGSATDGLPGYKTSIGGKVAAAAAVRAGRRAIDDDDVSRSPSPEIDTGVGKNKGRRGHENDSYASRYGSHEDDDDDDDEAAHSDNSDSVYSDDENVISPVIPRSRAAAAAASTTARPFRRPRFDDDDSDSEAESPTSAASPSRAPQTQGSSSHSPAADANTVEISARERQRLGIPANMNLTRASLARFEQRKRDEGRLAMRQNASGDIDEE